MMGSAYLDQPDSAIGGRGNNLAHLRKGTLAARIPQSRQKNATTRPDHDAHRQYASDSKFCHQRAIGIQRGRHGHAVLLEPCPGLDGPRRATILVDQKETHILAPRVLTS